MENTLLIFANLKNTYFRVEIGKYNKLIFQKYKNESAYIYIYIYEKWESLSNLIMKCI